MSIHREFLSAQPLAASGRAPAVLDLRDKVEDLFWYGPHTLRFGVTTIAPNSIESELAEGVLPDQK